MVFAATTVVILRLNGEDTINNDDEEEKMASQFKAGYADVNDVVYKSTSKFSFLVGYSVELVFALFVYYFLTSTVYFSGILGCGRIPILGGRPYELRQEAKRASGSQSQNEDEFENYDL